MTIRSHLIELERRHVALEEQIRYEQLHPLTDTIRVQELKRKKLYLKEQIENLKKSTASDISDHRNVSQSILLAV
jgi:hypothetical protein